jgi:hypothetical protein
MVTASRLRLAAGNKKAGRALSALAPASRRRPLKPKHPARAVQNNAINCWNSRFRGYCQYFLFGTSGRRGCPPKESGVRDVPSNICGEKTKQHQFSNQRCSVAGPTERRHRILVIERVVVAAEHDKVG